MKAQLPRAAAWTVLAALVACAPIIGLDAYVVGDDGSSEGGAGDATNVPEGGAVAISPATITFGESACGDTKTALLTLTNPGAARIAVEATLAANETFTLLGATDGTFRTELAPNESRTLTLTARNDATGTKSAAVVVTVGAEVVRVPLQLVTHGALLKVEPDVIDFGSVRKNTIPPPLSVVFRNDGDVAVTVTGLSGTTADFTLPSSVVVPGGGEATTSIAMKAGPAGAALSSTGTPVLSVPLCGPTPALTLKGRRVDQDVTVNPAIVELGAQPCNTLPSATAKVTISNYSEDHTVAFTASLVAPSSRFKLVESSGSVNTATGATPGTTDIILGVNGTGAMPATFEESLEVKITSPTVSARTETLKLHVDVTGVLLALSAPSLTFTSTTDNSINVTNTGNVKACFKYVVAGSSRLAAEAGDELPALGSDDLEIAWAAFGGAPPSGDGTVTMQAVACAGVSGPVLPFCAPAPTLAVKHR